MIVHQSAGFSRVIPCISYDTAVRTASGTMVSWIRFDGVRRACRSSSPTTYTQSAIRRVPTVDRHEKLAFDSIALFQTSCCIFRVSRIQSLLILSAVRRSRVSTIRGVEIFNSYSRQYEHPNYLTLVTSV